MSGSFLLADSLTEGIAKASVEVPEFLKENVLRVAIDALDFAKEQAPWTDRTGAARDGLDTDVSEDGETIVWTLFHTVDYGIWLETIQNGRFSVIMPTLELYAPQVGVGLSETVEAVDYG